MPILDEIVNNLKKMQCILFLGAMASAPSPEGSRFQYKETPPSGSELSRRLAKKCDYPYEDVTNLQRVSLYFQFRPGGSRKSLVEAIREEITKFRKIGDSGEVTERNIDPSPALHMLAALPFPIVITTNYDRLFDIALSRANTRDGSPKQPIVRIYDPISTGPPEAVPLDPSEQEPILLKLHGDVSRPESIVMTEEDYLVFIQKMSDSRQHSIHENIRARINSWSVLFIGYSLKDYNLRLLFRTLRWHLDVARIPLSFSVDPYPDDLIVSVWRYGEKPMVNFVQEDLWNFVPVLYREIMEVSTNMKNDEGGSAPASPYRGIHPFRYADREYFFGREKPVEELFVKILLSRLVLLFGESGTGKSSLINAGIIPALKKEGLSPERLRVRPITDEPILIERIQAGEKNNGNFLPSIFVDDKLVGAETESRVACSLERFRMKIEEKAPDAYPVLIFDQFEELFTLFEQSKGEDEETAKKKQELRGKLLDEIFKIVNNETLKVKVVIIIREDFLGKVEIFAKKYPQVFDYRVRLGYLDESGARKAILGPFGDKEKKQDNPFPSRLTEDLAKVIVQELSKNQPSVQIQPTQLQIICSRLWEKYASTKPEITVQDFEEEKGVKGILEGFLKSELELVPDLRSQGVIVLGNLVTEAGTRDVVSVDKLRGLIADIDENKLSSTLNFLEDRRLVNRTHQRETYYYEIASEYLVQPIQKEMEQLARERRRRVTRLLIAIASVVVVIVIGFALFSLYQADKRDKAAEEVALAFEKYQLHRYDEALAALDRAIEIDPKYVDAYNIRGNVYLDRGEYEKAIAEYNKAIELDPNYKWAHRNKGSALYKLGLYNEALVPLDRAIEIDPKYVDAYNIRGNVYLDRGEYEKAIAEYNKAIELDPNYKWAHRNKGSALYKLGLYNEALVPLDRAIEIDPKYADPYNDRGNVYLDRGEYEKAIAEYNKAIKLNPDYADAHINRGLAYYYKGDYDQAVDDYNQAIKLNPNYALAYMNRGLAHHYKGDYDQAIDDYNRAIDLNPDYVDAYINRGVAYYYKGHYDKAIADFNRAIKLNPDYADAYDRLGYTYLIQNELEKAVIEFEKAIRLDPKNYSPVLNLSLAYALQGRADEARALWRKGLVLLQGKSSPADKLNRLVFTVVLRQADGIAELQKVLVEDKPSIGLLKGTLNDVRLLARSPVKSAEIETIIEMLNKAIAEHQVESEKAK